MYYWRKTHGISRREHRSNKISIKCGFNIETELAAKVALLKIQYFRYVDRKSVGQFVLTGQRKLKDDDEVLPHC